MNELLNLPIFIQSLTHPSYANEYGGEHNERLEFLGDSVLQLCITELLYRKLPNCNEGELSQARKSLVNNMALSEVSQSLGLGTMVKLGKGQLLSDRILANTFEAVVGALFLHAGLKECQDLIDSNFENRLSSALKIPPKRLLHEWTQKTFQQVPEYEIVNVEGPDHQRVYQAVVKINNEPRAYGVGKTKQKATIDAANNAATILGLV